MARQTPNLMTRSVTARFPFQPLTRRNENLSLLFHTDRHYQMQFVNENCNWSPMDLASGGSDCIDT